MSKGKKIFLLLAAVFLAMLFYASYDFAKKTTFPGSRDKNNSGPDDSLLKNDSIFKDSTLNRRQN